MVPTGLLTGQIMMVFATVLLGLWSATQWTAAALGYQMRLGAPWFDLLGSPIVGFVKPPRTYGMTLAFDY